MKVKEILENRTQWIPSTDYEQLKPVVSVLLPTWKRAEGGFFQAAVESVINQTLENIELIIVDDCSFDGTFDMIKDFMENDRRISCIRHLKNIGLPAISEFEAFQKARGEYIAFIFDDNEWKFDALEKLVDYAKQNDVKAVAGRYEYFNGKPGESLSNPDSWAILGGKDEEINNLLIRNCFANGSVLLKREVINQIGFFDPNISLCRVCDWDLWCRIAKEYRFELTDILVGREKGSGLNDSLGNTHQLYQWASQERMRQPRNIELLPENFLDCDVFDTTLQSSPFLYRSNYWASKQFEKKDWYSVNDQSLLNIKIKSEQNWNGKRVTYLTDSTNVDASSILIWKRLPYSPDYVLFFSSLQYFDYNNWILSDLIIIERHVTSQANTVVEWAKKRGIACYYYTDDNFLAFAKDYRKESSLSLTIKNLTQEITQSNLKKFDGIVCSSTALCDFFANKKFNKNCFLIEPIVEKTLLSQYNELGDVVKILFFGSATRGKLISQFIYKSIEVISRERKIEFYCPEETFKTIYDFNSNIIQLKSNKKKFNSSWLSEFKVNDNFKIKVFKRILSLELLIQRLSQEKINLQLHCGPIIENNNYKTVNALINATCLGAVLITTNCPPYSNIKWTGKTCFLADNTKFSWESTIREAIDAKVHSAIYENAYNFCSFNFDPQKGKDYFVNAIDKISTCSMPDLPKRLLNQLGYLSDLMRSAAHVRPLSVDHQAPVQYTNKFLSYLFLFSLNSWELYQTLKALFPDYARLKRGFLKLFPDFFSAPIFPSKYFEQIIDKNHSKAYLIIFPSQTTTVLFEFISNQLCLSQSTIETDEPVCVRLDIPESTEPIKLRIYNFAGSSKLFVLMKRTFFGSEFQMLYED